MAFSATGCSASRRRQARSGRSTHSTSSPPKVLWDWWTSASQIAFAIISSLTAMDGLGSMIFRCILNASGRPVGSSLLNRYQYLVYEVYPLFWNVLEVWWHLYLSSKHLLPDLFPVLTQVGSFADQQFKSNHTHSVVICAEGVVLAHQHFRRHVPRSPTSLMCILRPPIPGNPKISNPAVPLLIEDDILRFQIPVDDIFWMQIVQSFHNATNDKL